MSLRTYVSEGTFRSLPGPPWRFGSPLLDRGRDRAVERWVAFDRPIQLLIGNCVVVFRVEKEESLDRGILLGKVGEGIPIPSHSVAAHGQRTETLPP